MENAWTGNSKISFKHCFTPSMLVLRRETQMSATRRWEANQMIYSISISQLKKSKHQFAGGKKQTPAVQHTAQLGGQSDSVWGLAVGAVRWDAVSVLLGPRRWVCGHCPLAPSLGPVAAQLGVDSKPCSSRHCRVLFLPGPGVCWGPSDSASVTPTPPTRAFRVSLKHCWHWRDNSWCRQYTS